MGCLNKIRSLVLHKTGTAEEGGGDWSDTGVLININSPCHPRVASCFGLVADFSYLGRIKLARRLTVKVKSAVTGWRLVEAVRSHSIPAPCRRWSAEETAAGMGLTPGWQ